MQLEIYTPTEGQTLPPIEWNFAAIKQWLEDGLQAYKGRVYDDSQIKEAKKDAASLRKLREAIDGKRKEMKNRYLEPYTTFEAQAKELTGMIDEQVADISAQINAYDEARKAEKQEHIKALYAEIMDDLAALVPYEKIHSPKWLNVTVSIKAIEAEIVERAENIRAALASIDGLGLPDEMAGRVKSVYLAQLDLAAVLAEKDRIEREQAALAEYEAKKKQQEAREAKTEQPIPQEALGYAADEPPELLTVDFRVYATREQLGKLKAFLVEHGIKYGKVPTR